MSRPITNLTIERFRGLRDLHLADFGQFNLLVGINNSGKTSVLEALSLYCAPLEPWSWITTSGRREPGTSGPRIRNIDRLRWLFPQQAATDPSLLYKGSVRVDATGSAHIRSFTAECHELRGTRVESAPGQIDVREELAGDATDEAGIEIERRGCQIDVDVTAATGQGSLFDPQGLGTQTNSFVFWEDERFSSHRRSIGPSLPNQVITPYEHWFPAQSVRRFSDARLGGSEDFEGAVLDLLRSIDPRIIGVEVLAPRTFDAVLYLRDAAVGLLPLSAFGDGLRRVLLMALAIPRAANGILLVDELETGIHVSALAGVFRWMLDACKKYKVQLFVTTHSLEALDAMLVVDTTPEEDIVGYRLEPTADGTKVQRYGEDLLKRLRSDRGLDVR